MFSLFYDKTGVNLLSIIMKKDLEGKLCKLYDLFFNIWGDLNILFFMDFITGLNRFYNLKIIGNLLSVGTL